MFEIIQACPRCSIIKTKIQDNLSDGLCSDCSIRTVAVRRFADANVPVEYWDLNMSEFQGEQKLKDKYEEIVNDLPGAYRKGLSFCFAGSYGVGKTMTFCNIVKTAALKGYTCLYTTLGDIVSVLLSRDEEDKYIARKELLSVDFLVIDEVDPRYMANDNASDLFGRMFETILRTRSQNRLPTFLSTNSPNLTESFQGSLKVSIDSIMKGYVKSVFVHGDDFRKTQKK